MAYGHTSRVIDYLLWACMCMETSVLLLGMLTSQLLYIVILFIESLLNTRGFFLGTGL